MKEFHLYNNYFIFKIIINTNLHLNWTRLNCECGQKRIIKKENQLFYFCKLLIF